MEIGETLYVTTRQGFRDWLVENHKARKEIWLIQYKKATKKPSIKYMDAVEEALCFGWIDGFEKGMDAEKLCPALLPPPAPVPLDGDKQRTRQKDDRRR